MLIVVDDVLDADNLEMTQAFFSVSANREMQWVAGSLDERMLGATPMSAILEHARCAFDNQHGWRRAVGAPWNQA